jgi:PBSX family phage terminase large subunit
MNEKKLLWLPTEPQIQVLQSTAKFRLFLGGIGAGKTAIGWMNVVLEAVEQPGSLGVIIAPTYQSIRDVIWREMPNWLPEDLIEGDLNETKKELQLINGSQILFRSADNPRNIERLRGMSIAWFWADEVTIMPKLVWEIMVGRLRQPGMKYRAWLTGTPRMNWVYDTFIEKSLSEDYFVVKEIPTFSNIHLPPDYIKSLEEQYSGQFYDQEILGKFVSFEGLIYDVGPDNIIDEPLPKHGRVVYGVDFGFKNPSAIVVLTELGNKLYIVDEFYQRRVTDDELVDILKYKQDIWGPGPVYCDPSAPASIEKFKREKIHAVKADNDVLGGIRQVRAAFDSKRLFITSNCQNLINETKSYVWDDSETKEQPVKLNDHGCDAARYALRGFQSGGDSNRFTTMRTSKRNW